MSHLEIELQQLDKAIVEMIRLAKSQLKKSKKAFLNMDTELAQEIVHHEKRMNALELSIDRDCENILALFNPVATDMRFVVSMLKTNSDLERIGDYADSIADYVIELNKPFKKDLVEAVKLVEMFDITISMMEDIQRAFEDQNDILARKVFKEDKKLNKINKKSARVITKFIEQDISLVNQSLYLFSTIRKLERVGDHIKNVAEDIIFHLEAEVLKHQKKKKT